LFFLLLYQLDGFRFYFVTLLEREDPPAEELVPCFHESEPLGDLGPDCLAFVVQEHDFPAG